MKTTIASFCGVLICSLGFFPSTAPAQEPIPIVAARDTTLPRVLGLRFGMSVKEVKKAFKARALGLVAETPQSDAWNHGKYTVQGTSVDIIGDTECSRETRLCFCNKGLAEIWVTFMFDEPHGRDKECRRYKKILLKEYGEPDTIITQQKTKHIVSFSNQLVESVRWDSTNNNLSISISKYDVWYDDLMEPPEYYLDIRYEHLLLASLWWEEMKEMDKREKEQKRLQKDSEELR